jgi:hypothetical protein
VPEALPVPSAPKDAIAKVGHTGNQLFITFHDGRIWRFDGLPKRFVDGLLLASDRDAYFKQNFAHYVPVVQESVSAA